MKLNFLLFIITLLGAVLISGCGNTTSSLNDVCNENSSFENMIIVAGNHANAKKASYKSIEKDIEQIALKYGNICVIIDDGNPYIAADIEIPHQKNGLSQSKKLSIAKNQVSQVEQLLESEECMAKTEGVNLIKSLEIVERIMKSAKYANGKTKVYIFDSGLSTEGIDFTEMNKNFYEFQNTVNSYIRDNELLVDLNGIEVDWYGLCDVAAPQNPLTKRERNLVACVWKEYLYEAGATVNFKSDISTDEYSNKLPDVEVVEVCSNIMYVDEYVDISDTEEFPEAIIIDESSIRFQSGTASISDYAVAKEQLSSIAEYLLNNPEENILLVGSTAHWGDLEGYCIPLSENRCNTVKELLNEFGILSERMTIVGMGYDNPFYINDIGEDGKLIEENAIKNRCIVIMSTKAELANAILNNSWR